MKPTANQIEAAALCMEHLVDHDWHGYDWGYRWGDGEGTCPVNTPAGTCFVEQGDRDCSSAVISAYEAAGISCGGATYTGNMRSCMCSTGNFRAHRMSNGYDCDDGYVAKRGDCYVNEINHTAMCISAVPDMLAEFSINEFGGVYGGRTGDQTGRESHRGMFYSYPWDFCLEVLESTDETEPEQKWFVTYCASLDPRGVEWLPEMHDYVDTGGSTDRFAGDPPGVIRWFAMKCPGGVRYRACSQASGWLPWVENYDLSDLEYGCAGDGSPIVDIEFDHKGIDAWFHHTGANGMTPIDMVMMKQKED